ncbi:complement factor H-related protein 1-like isoform X1 [Rhinolophus sinicus]|uniref:complement factor H-related protein 1-like isoform X1 n=1 Tax=Rhinolophus sinicus TaxID=89399 RepID=UPI003D7971F0
MLLLISVILTLGVSWAHAQVQSCDFPEIKHGSLYKENKYKPDFPVTVGSWYYYSCNDSFVTHSESFWHWVTCTGEGWSPPVPCRRKCVFQSVENGVSPYHQRKYFQGDSAKVDCHPGYSLPNEQTSMTCTENGWSPPPTCIRVNVSCANPPAVENARLVDEMPKYLPGDTVHYECIGPLTLFGNGEVMCLNGSWTEPPQCKESEGKCGPPPPTQNGGITTFPLAEYAPGSCVEYQCQCLYERQGDKQITCGDGEWQNHQNAEVSPLMVSCILRKSV